MKHAAKLIPLTHLHELVIHHAGPLRIDMNSSPTCSQRFVFFGSEPSSFHWGNILTQRVTRRMDDLPLHMRLLNDLLQSIVYHCLIFRLVAAESTSTAALLYQISKWFQTGWKTYCKSPAVTNAPTRCCSQCLCHPCRSPEKWRSAARMFFCRDSLSSSLHGLGYSDSQKWTWALPISTFHTTYVIL